ncbi:MAG: ABC transporter permease [Oscillospiraceae bacterium]|jgi:ABC-type uncharacterized transport system permease subunit
MSDFLNWFGNFIGATVRMATPIMFVAIGSCVTEKGGILNMAGEAMMLASSLFGVVFVGLTGSTFVGIIAGALVSVLVTLFICFAAFVMKVDMYLMSISMNMALLGGVIFAMWLIYGVKSNTSAFVHFNAVPNISIPFIKNIPILGQLLDGHNLFTYIGLVFAWLTYFLLYKTKFGLRVRAIGQNPMAAESVGINPKKIYTLAFVYAAIVSSFGGMYLSMGYQNFFIKNITANRGFIGLAACSAADARPGLSVLMSLLFGLAYAITNSLKVYIIEQQLLAAMPYLLTTIIIIVLSYRRYTREQRLMRENRRKLAEMREKQMAEEAESAAKA